MKLINQVCTIQQSERFKEFGITAPSTFWHFRYGKTWDIQQCDEETCKYQIEIGVSNEYYPAYNLSELMRAYGGNVTILDNMLTNPSDYLAEDLLYQMGVGVISAEDVNKRLALD